jgi:hypothetical protein
VCPVLTGVKRMDTLTPVARLFIDFPLGSGQDTRHIWGVVSIPGQCALMKERDTWFMHSPACTSSKDSFSSDYNAFQVSRLEGSPTQPRR